MATTKNICILGSTGSIGQSSLDVIANFPEEFRPLCLTANRNTGVLLEQIRRFQPRAVAVLDEAAAAAVKASVNGSTAVYAGLEGLDELVRREDVDVVINSLVGFAGLRPTVEALRRGKTVALANKETLVVAGEIITRLAREHNARIVPIDSEHSAILQCLAGEDPAMISRLIITASGGPFLDLPKGRFADVTVAAALRHPTWKMGNKITIDSATMMNKGLEIIEAHWLFGLPAAKIEVLIHPQSIIHSMVEFVDGSVKAQLGIPDMKIPIQYALTFPGRAPSMYRRIDFAELSTMTFQKSDMEKFECLALAYRALEEGGSSPVVLNAANEVAVELFLAGAVTFERIPKIIRAAMERIPCRPMLDIDEIVATDRIARETARRAAATTEPA